MPKKTKKHKVLADKRRTNIYLQNGQPPTFSYSLNTDRLKIDRLDSPKLDVTAQYSYVGRDLLKIAFFALLAISIQIVLVFLLRTK